MALFRFGGFEADTSTRELRRNGSRVPLQPQPFQILCLLLEEAGQVVTRVRLIGTVWEGGQPADADRSLNIAIRKLRDALGDSLSEPRFLQTISKVGYRFIEEVEVEAPHSSMGSPDRTVTPTLSSEAAPPEIPSKNTMMRAFLVVFLSALVLVGIYWISQTRFGDRGPRYLVVLAQFEDSTGQMDLAGTYESYLESELADSQMVSVASAERISDTLRLMRKESAGRPVLEDAVEICKRDPNIRAVVGGEVRKVGNTYVLSMRLVDPATGSTMIGRNGESSDRAALVKVVREFSVAVRRRMGEDPPPQQTPLDKVTTQSLQALKLYTDGHSFGRQGKWQTAEVLFREAIRLDPEFASAHVFLAWSIRNKDPQTPAESFVPIAARAVKLANRASESEALFIRASYHSLRQEHAEAIPIYEVLLRRYPDHPWVINNLLNAYSHTHQRAMIRSLQHQLLTLRPNDPVTYSVNIPACFCPPDDDTRKALRYAERYVDLTRQSGLAETAGLAMGHRSVYKAMAAWAQGDVKQTSANLEEAERLLAGISNLGRAQGLRLHVAAGRLTLGELNRAAMGIPTELPDTVRYRWQIWPAIFAGDWTKAAELAAAQELVPAHPLNALGILKAGAAASAARMLSRQDGTTNTVPEAVMLVEGELALNEGRANDAIPILAKALETMPEDVAERMLAAQSLAKALVSVGRMDEAIIVLETATSKGRACGGFLRAAFWPHTRFDLMELYRKRNRLREAEAIRTELKTLLALADENHVLRKALN